MRDTIKITFVGESNVGKTSIIERYITNKFNNQTPTIGASFIARDIAYNNKVIKLGIWDTAGQERYQALSTVYLRNTRICILVFDVTCYYSFQKLRMWKNICDESNSTIGQHIVFFLVGNKVDLEDRVVPTQELEDFCDTYKIQAYIETSAFNGTGVNDLYDRIIHSASLLDHNKLEDNKFLSVAKQIEQSADSCIC